MAVLLEAISIIVRRKAIDAQYFGGWQTFKHDIPDTSFCYDADLVRIGFTAAAYASAYVSELEERGLILLLDGEFIDIAVVDQIDEPSIPVHWLELTRIELFEPAMKIYVCWLKGKKMKKIATPAGWKYEGSLS